MYTHVESLKLIARKKCFAILRTSAVTTKKLLHQLLHYYQINYRLCCYIIVITVLGKKIITLDGSAYLIP